MEHRIRIVICALCLVFLALGACKHEKVVLAKPNENYRPAAEYLKNNGEFSLLYAALVRTDLVGAFNANGTLTLFAPNNQAFNEWGILRPSDFEKFPVDSLRAILRYHVLNRRLNSADISAMTRNNPFMTSNGDSVLVAMTYSSPTPEWFVNGATITRSNVQLSNGVLHVINKVLKRKASSVQRFLELRPEYSTFVVCLKKFGLWAQLAEAGPWTVMAPNNNAFEKEGLSLSAIEALRVDAYGKRLFGAYVFNIRFFVKDFNLFGGYIGRPIKGDEDFSIYASSFDPKPFYVRRTDGTYTGLDRTINLGEEAILDYLCENGVVHGLNDLVLLPEQALK